MRFLFALLCCFTSVTGWATTVSHSSATPHILVIASQRNAETIAQAAQQYFEQTSDKVVARTDTQWLELNQLQRQELLNSADVLVGIGLFGAVVNELSHDLTLYPPAESYIFSSDHRLVGLSQTRHSLTFSDNATLKTLAATRPPADDFSAWLTSLIKAHPKQEKWLMARGYWQAGGMRNTLQLLYWLAAQLNSNMTYQPAQMQPRLMWWSQAGYSEQFPSLETNKPYVALIDHAGADRPSDSSVFQSLCREIETTTHSQCIVALANWGQASVDAVAELQNSASPLGAIVMLQDFVLGGGEGREQVTQLLTKLNVPVLKAIKLRDRTQAEWLNSADGMAADKVYYQISMPEIQGASQPLIVATAGKEQIDTISGIQIKPIVNEPSGMTQLTQRIARWQVLQTKVNKDKRIAIVYYNHPPGRHNIGADNLDVPASLWHILNKMKAQGYDVGHLPDSQDALLDMIQEQAVNLPNDQHALASMAPHINTISTDEYLRYFNTLSPTLRDEVEFGPLGRLDALVKANIQQGQKAYAKQQIDATMEEMFHLVEGADHPGRKRALSLLNQLRDEYQTQLHSASSEGWNKTASIIAALSKVGIEALGGWGKAPGNVMTYQQKILLPGIQFGHVFISPQPPRGWEVNEELLHANLAFPPPHQYLAYYHFLKDTFKADAIVHLGRHSTYEFLPHRSIGLADDDYSRLIAGDIPGIYPYIVDGVGEGIQAKRRGLAVMVDHLTPPLESTPLYDDLLQLRQLIESYEANKDSENKALPQTLITQIRSKVETLNLKDELAESMSAELAVMGISFEEVDDAMLVHEIGHYLTNLQERFMPYGLHIFGKEWQPEALSMMLTSMAPTSDHEQQSWKNKLQASPTAEMHALFAGLDGHFIAPGKGNDPIRSPDSLPTGRNFYALDNSLIPSKVAWEIGQKMASEARLSNPYDPNKREAQILWASDVVRDEGVMVAFALDMMGLKPKWNSRGLVNGLEVQALETGRHRRDMVFTTSGLFRDLYALQMEMLDRAVLISLAQSAKQIELHYPTLIPALDAALAPLGKRRSDSNEPLQSNQIAAHWVEDTQALLAQGIAAKEAAHRSSLRLFGDAPGSYGAGINRLVERSGAWQQRQELADVYLRRLGHAYSSQGFGEASQDTFKHLLTSVQNTYFGRSSNLYGLIDNNDAFDYLGGLSLTVETLSGQTPNNFVLNHSDPHNIVTQPLKTALRQELRGRFLNPEWLKGLMNHGYAGARTMGSEFLEYLWGWQVTNPTLVGDWAWEEVKDVYLDDRYQLGLDEFLQQGQNVHVKANMLAIMLVAINKGFWQATDETTRDIASQFADLVAQNGLPGSGHTTPDHPMMPWLEQYLTPQQWQELKAELDKARPTEEKAQEQHSITEITLTQEQSDSPSDTKPRNEEVQQVEETGAPQIMWVLLVFALLFIVLSAWRRNHNLINTMRGTK